MSGPALSYILATDALDTVRGVLEALARQTRVEALELVLVSPAELVEELYQIPPELLRVRLLKSAAPLRLPAARALGILEATAPVVFVGETHSFPEPEMVERLLEAFDGPWSAVVPALVNANPAYATSWAGFLLDYGLWNCGRPASGGVEPLVYNAAFRREPLLGLGARLAEGISGIDRELWRGLAAAGHRGAFAPGARIRHLNVDQRPAFLRERFLCGVRLGLHRARRWPWVKRLAYAAAWPLIPFVLARRARPAVRHYAATTALPPTTFGWIAIALVARAAGEAIGYLGLGGDGVERVTTELEVHKVRYAREPG